MEDLFDVQEQVLSDVTEYDICAMSYILLYEEKEKDYYSWKTTSKRPFEALGMYSRVDRIKISNENSYSPGVFDFYCLLGIKDINYYEFEKQNFFIKLIDLPDNNIVKIEIQNFINNNSNKCNLISYFQKPFDKIPSYDYFCREIVGDFSNRIIVYLEHYFKEKYEISEKEQNNIYIEFGDLNICFSCQYENTSYWEPKYYKTISQYTLKYAKITNKSKEELQTYLRYKGFPYQENYEEYIRFLENFKFYCDMFNHIREVGDLYFKYPLFRLFKILVPRKIRNEFLNHTHIVGRSGSGKSELLKTIIKQVGESCILLDPHGDIADSLDKKQNFFKIAPTENCFVINPFDIEDKSIDNRELVSEEIIQLLQEIIQDSNVSVLMKTISFPIISTLLKLPYADFRMLADCINPISGIEHLERLTPLVDDHLKHIWNDLKTDTYDTTKRSIFNRLQSFLNKHKIVSTVCGYDDFNNAIKRVEQGENLVISLPIPQLGEDVSEVLGRFFMCRLQIWAKRRQTLAEKDRKPVLLIVDECQNYLSEETARTLDQFGRKFGLYMVLAHQHIAQIDGKGLKGSMLANCKNKIVGYCDESTAKPMGNAIGVSYEEFTELKKGHWWGLFEDQKPLKFYARLAKFKTVGETINYAQSQNTEFLDGWKLVKAEMKNATQNTTKTPKFTAKFDL